MKKMASKICVVSAVLLMAGNLFAAVMGTTNLLGTTGTFETAADQAAWTMQTDYAANMDLEYTAEAAFPGGTYGAELKRKAGTSGNGSWMRLTQTISTVGNREHRFIFRAKRLNDVIGGTQYIFGGGWSNFTTNADKSWTTPWTQKTIAGTGATNLLVLFQHQMGTDDPDPAKVLCIDEVEVLRELAAPEVTAQSESAGVWTLSNAGGVNGDSKLIAFDSDVTVSHVSGFDVGQVSVTWDSDNQIRISFENELAGITNLRVTNPYGTESFDFTVVPEPATFVLISIGAISHLIRRKK